VVHHVINRSAILRSAVRSLATFLIALSVFQTSFGQATKVPEATEKLGAEIAAKIAKENQITIDLFKQIQASEEARKSVVLVDVRSDNETKVSVIPGAITKAQFEADPEKYKGKTAICYCLSGGRSGKYVKQLKAKDAPAVDLKGSMLGWCEARLPLTTLDGKPTKRVNVYGNKVPSEYESVE
jgi:rhodanese-related sulfurtransferase